MWSIAIKIEETEDEVIDAMEDRRDIIITDGRTLVDWRVESLSSLFRGSATAPSLEKYPEEYFHFFASIERPVLDYADSFEEPTDNELLGIYSNLARRPDGAGGSLLHNHLWQACALALGTRPWSGMQLEAVLRRLQRSCRTFRMHPSSKNYLNYLRQGEPASF
ncbi:MAG: hypothetical protein Q8M07_07075 [Prosthecobacter sp.]|nr:hypothetical protein [Prosthecobacter sp.]